MSLRNKNSNPVVAGDQVTATDLNESLFTGNQVQIYPLGESFTGATTPQPAAIINDIAMVQFSAISSYGAAATPSRATKIIPRTAVTVASVLTQLYRGTDPSTNLTIEIQTDAAGVPSGTPVSNGTSGTIATSTLKNTEFRLFNFTFSTPPVLAAGTTYWVVFKVSATNANELSVPTLANASKYASFDGALHNGTSWSAGQVIPYIELIPTSGGSYSLWQSDADGVDPIAKFDGFVLTTGSAGATGTLVRAGGVTGFTLTTGADYFVSTTKGTITINKNEGSYVGTALNTTDLVVPKSRSTSRLLTGMYKTMIVSGEAGNSFYSAIYTALEDGYFTFLATATVKNSTAATLGLNVMSTYTNATSPGSAGTAVSYLSTAANQGDHAGTMIVKLRRGERIQFGQGNAGGGGNTPSITSMFFQPIE